MTNLYSTKVEWTLALNFCGYTCGGSYGALHKLPVGPVIDSFTHWDSIIPIISDVIFLVALVLGIRWVLVIRFLFSSALEVSSVSGQSSPCFLLNLISFSWRCYSSPVLSIQSVSQPPSPDLLRKQWRSDSSEWLVMRRRTNKRWWISCVLHVVILC